MADLKNWATAVAPRPAGTEVYSEATIEVRASATRSVDPSVRIRRGGGTAVRTGAERSTASTAGAGAGPELPDGAVPHVLALLAAAADGARSGGAGDAEVSLWHWARRHRVEGDARPAVSGFTELTALTVTTRDGAGRGAARTRSCSLLELTEACAHAAGAAAAAESRAAGRAGPARSGDTVAVLFPAAAAVLVHELVGHGLEADTALAGSALWRARDSKAFGSGLSVRDDPGDQHAWWTPAVDDEGVPCRSAPLIVDGTVAGTVSDRASAQRAGTEPTGHGRRSGPEVPPAPRMRHTVLSRGPDDAEDLVGGTDRGVLVESVDGGDADPRTGRFTLRARSGREVHRGRRGRAVRDFTLVGDLGVLTGIDGVGSVRAADHALCRRSGGWLPVSSSTPALRIARIAVHGTVGG